MGNNSTVFVTQEANQLTLPKKPAQVFPVYSTATWKTHFEASKHSSKLMVVYFTAAWCGPCRNFEPVVRDFAATYVNVDFSKIDADVLEGVAKEYGVQAMPTFILMKKGKVIDKVVGVKKEELQKKIEKFMTNTHNEIMHC